MDASSDEFNGNIGTAVYATDFSSCAENAGRYAQLLAMHFRANFFVVHAFVLSQAALEVELGGKHQKSQQRIDLQGLLDRKALRLSSSSLKAVPVLLEGDPHYAVSTFVEENAPSLVVLGTHGGGRVERELIGSVAETILRSTSWPSFTVGPQVPTVSSSSTALPFKRVLCATDFSPAATRAIRCALSIVESLGADIDVLNVIPERSISHPDRFTEIQSRFFDALDRFVPDRARSFSHPRTFVETGNAHDRILEHIKDRSIDLLVLGLRKTSHLGIEMRTSGAFRLIAEATCPVLTITG